MKTIIAVTFSMLLFATIASASVPQPTMAPEYQKRQSLPDGLNLSALLGDESSAIAQVSSLLTNPAFASIFTSITANPAFQSSVSAQLVSELGSSSAAMALSQYESALNNLNPSGSSSAPITVGTNSESGQGDGSSSTFTITLLMASAITLSTAAFLFAM